MSDKLTMEQVHMLIEKHYSNVDKKRLVEANKAACTDARKLLRVGLPYHTERQHQARIEDLRDRIARLEKEKRRLKEELRALKSRRTT